MWWATVIILWWRWLFYLAGELWYSMSRVFYSHPANLIMHSVSCIVSSQGRGDVLSWHIGVWFGCHVSRIRCKGDQGWRCEGVGWCWCGGVWQPQSGCEKLFLSSSICLLLASGGCLVCVGRWMVDGATLGTGLPAPVQPCHSHCREPRHVAPQQHPQHSHGNPDTRQTLKSDF